MLDLLSTTNPQWSQWAQEYVDMYCEYLAPGSKAPVVIASNEMVLKPENDTLVLDFDDLQCPAAYMPFLNIIATICPVDGILEYFDYPEVVKFKHCYNFAAHSEIVVMSYLAHETAHWYQTEIKQEQGKYSLTHGQGFARIYQRLRKRFINPMIREWKDERNRKRKISCCG